MVKMCISVSNHKNMQTKKLRSKNYEVFWRFALVNFNKAAKLSVPFP